MSIDNSAFAERYAAATESSDLRHRQTACHTDTLAAFAMSDQGIASYAYRAKVCNDPRHVLALHEKWVDEVRAMALRRRWIMRIDASKGQPKSRLVSEDEAAIHAIARISLDHWLFDVCPACSGRKYRTLREVMAEAGHVDADDAGRDSLSDHECPTCRGTGRRRVEAPSNLMPFVLRAIESLDGRCHDVARRAMLRLAQSSEP